MNETKPRFAMIEALERYAKDDDRAVLAALRRGLDPGGEARVYPYIARYFPADCDPWMERALVLVAALFALHPSSSERSLASGLRFVAEKSDSGSIELRFVALLNAHPDDLAEHLRHAVALCRSKDVGINWTNLLHTVLRWGSDDTRHPRREWARDFWTTNETEKK